MEALLLVLFIIILIVSIFQDKTLKTFYKLNLFFMPVFFAISLFYFTWEASRPAHFTFINEQRNWWEVFVGGFAASPIGFISGFVLIGSFCLFLLSIINIFRYKLERFNNNKL